MKKISKKQHLAINGSPPAFETPLHVGKPNIGSKNEFLKYVDSIFDSCWLSNNGPLVQQLERDISTYHDVKHCVAMCNGTVALEIAIRALNLKGEVILPSFTFVATAHALNWQGVKPMFADINTHDHCLDPGSVEKLISSNTTGIIGVHLWGNVAPVQELEEIARNNNLKLLFDAAHAFSCSYGGKMIGGFGECEVLSFHATKFFNTFEGGAVLTNNDELAEKMKLMRNFGFSGMDNVIYPGTNGKMMEIAAAMGIVNLAQIQDLLEVNESNYYEYQKELNGLHGISLLAMNEEVQSNYQYVVIEVEKSCRISRDDLVEALQAENILARKYFWPGCHNMQPYKDLFPDAGRVLPKTDSVANKVCVLPTGVAVNSEMIKTICSVIKTAIS
jgi:dTDP-4-amino-4,6-dideoxygalactose transaminase